MSKFFIIYNSQTKNDYYIHILIILASVILIKNSIKHDKRNYIVRNTDDRRILKYRSIILLE